MEKLAKGMAWGVACLILFQVGAVTVEVIWEYWGIPTPAEIFRFLKKTF